MSPPMVSLATKPDKEPVVDETCSVPKSDKLDFSTAATVTVESERNVRVMRAQRARQQTKRIACGIILVTIVAIAALATVTLVHRLRRRHRKHFECKYGKQELPEHVRVDHEHHLIYAKHAHDHHRGTPQLHMLHAYNRRLLAYKDEEKNVCYIDRLDETFEQGYTRWLSYEKHGHHEGKMLAEVSPKPIEIDVLRHVGDIHIYMHCKSATSYWYMEVDKKVSQNMVVVHV